jgi:hypothetical protein
MLLCRKVFCIRFLPLHGEIHLDMALQDSLPLQFQIDEKSYLNIKGKSGHLKVAACLKLLYIRFLSDIVNACIAYQLLPSMYNATQAIDNKVGGNKRKSGRQMQKIFEKLDGHLMPRFKLGRRFNPWYC